MGTKVTLAPELKPPVLRDVSEGYGAAQAVAPATFLDHNLLVLDGVAWEADMAFIQRHLVKQRRSFKDPFRVKDPGAPLLAQLKLVTKQATAIAKLLYSSFDLHTLRWSWRPMITGPEPLHYDTVPGLTPLVTSYINVSSEPRVYNIGMDFATLVQQYPGPLRQLVKDCKEKPVDLGYDLRQLTSKGTGPLGAAAPRHRVELASGAIWFFNAKTVSHEVVHGTGAVGASWEAPESGAQMQPELLKGLM